MTQHTSLWALSSHRNGRFDDWAAFTGAHDQGLYFWTYFAPWENEQMACIYDYLIEDLSSHLYSSVPAFRDSGKLA